MTNREKYELVFIECFSVDKTVLNSEFVYQCVPTWDSVGHMAMIAGLEEAFDIIMETDDILDLSSYTKGMEIVAKYGIEF